MFGSVSQCCSRSLPLTSDLLPTDTNSEMPIPSSPVRLISSMPSPPDCDRNATGPRTGTTGANVAFICTSGAVFTMPRQFGPMTRMPLRRAVATMACSASLPARSHLGEPGRDDHDAVHTFLRAVVDDRGNGVGRHHDERDVDRVGDVEDARVGAHARDRHRGRVHRVHRALEVVREQVAEQLVADRARAPARADDRDRTRREQPRRRRALGARLARFDRRDRVRRRFDREPHPHRAVHERPLRGPARVGEHVQHPRVVGQRVRGERRDAVRPARRPRGARAAACPSPRPCWSSCTENATSASSPPVRS